MTQTFEEYLEQKGLIKTKCQNCDNTPVYDSEGYFLCANCAFKKFKENKE